VEGWSCARVHECTVLGEHDICTVLQGEVLPEWRMGFKVDRLNG